MDITTRRAGLSPERRALLARRLAGQGEEAAPALDTIPRCAGDGPDYPASFMQEQMWLVTQLEPDKAVYNVPVAVLVRADADVPALERAFSEVVRRHEGLRTVFRVVDGQVRQVIQPPYPVHAEVRDERARVGDDFERDVRRLVTEEGSRTMDVENGPLVRMSLLRVSDEECALIITVHHIVTDGWAYPLLLGEIWTLYAADRRGETVELPPTGLRYVDYAVWQRTHLTGATLEAHVDFWRRMLEGAPVTELVGDRPRPPRPSYRGAFHHFVIDEATTTAIRELCRRETLTLNMALYAAFAALMAHYTGMRDVVVATLFGNRGRLELQDVVGCFVNSAALRMDFSDDPGLAEASRRARRMILEADAHQELPFEKVVEALRVERDPSRNPVFQVMYFHHTFIPSHTSAGDGGLGMRQVYEDNRAALVDTGLSKIDLSLATLEDGGRLTGVVEYATDLYDAATIDRFCRHYCTLLARAGAEPDRPLMQISLLDDAERRTLEAWGHGETRPVETAPLHRMFEAQAARTPGAEAIRFRGASLTYAELNARANALARRLAARGVTVESVVAVSLERSPDLVTAFLAVNKAGGVFLPVDPAYPAERRRWMVEDSGARLILTRAALAAGLPETGAAVMALDESSFAAEAGDAENLAVPVDPENAAYVIFTSGSTGRPKGVVVPHRGIGNLAAAHRQAFGIGEGTRMLQFSSFSFDVAVWDVSRALLGGACMVLADDEAAGGGDALLSLLRRERVQFALLPPALLAATPEPEDGLPDLRTVVSGGDVVTAEVARRWGAGRRFVNGYGPTETTVCATVEIDPAPEGRVSIGRPLPNLTAYVLDAAMRPVPAGVPGELFVGGIAVARGYLHRPATTAERFIPDPFAAAPGARFYRTGDVVRWRADGGLEFVGRADRQVKVRGFRIELGEVEAALLAQPGVREVAAVAHEAVAGSRRLAAYVAGDGITVDEVRAGLRQVVPEYMVPQAFVLLPALPRLPSGKLDVRALPAILSVAADDEGDHTAPRTRAEEVLARVWAQVLGRESVGIHENFFELGGDSILSIQVIVRAAREGVRIALRQVFQHQTVAELAAAADTAMPISAEQGPVTGDAPPTPAQRWMLARAVPNARHWNMALALEARGRLDPRLLQQAADAVLAHHDALRTRFVPGEGGWIASTDAPSPAAFDLVDLSSIPMEQVEMEIEARAAEVQAGMDLAAGPLFRVALFDVGTERPQQVLIAAHHFVVDAISLPVLAEDLEAAYRQLAAGGEVRLPAKTTAFLEWARRLDERARGPETLEQLPYWLGALPASAAPLPVDVPGAVDDEAGTTVAVAELSAAETRALLEEVPAAFGTQVNDALLAALAQAFHVWTGRHSVLVDVEGHGREDLWEDVDVSRTVGWFTSVHPVHLEAKGDAAETLRGVKETLRAVPDRGIGYGLLRWSAGDAAAELASRPMAEVSFNYLGQAGAAAAPDRDALLVPSAMATGPTRDPGQPRLHRVAVEGVVADGVLRMGIWFGARVYRAETMERLAEAYAAALRALIERARAPRDTAYTPEDFPGARMDQDELDDLLAQLDEV